MGGRSDILNVPFFSPRNDNKEAFTLERKPRFCLGENYGLTPRILKIEDYWVIPKEYLDIIQITPLVLLFFSFKQLVVTNRK